MPEQLLHESQIHAAVEAMSSAGMPEHMGVDMSNAGTFCGGCDDSADLPDGELSRGRFRLLLGQLVFEIGFQCKASAVAVRNLIIP